MNEVERIKLVQTKPGEWTKEAEPGEQCVKALAWF